MLQCSFRCFWVDVRSYCFFSLLFSGACLSLSLMFPLSFLITSFQYEAAWRAGNWDFSLLSMGDSSSHLSQDPTRGHFHEHLYRYRGLTDFGLTFRPQLIGTVKLNKTWKTN